MRGVQGRKHFLKIIYFSAMENRANIIYLDHLVDMQTYANLCGIGNRAVQRRMREKRLIYIKIDGLHLFDTITSPPVKKLPLGFKPVSRVVSGKGVNLSDLTKLNTFAKSKKLTCDRFYKGILAGKLKAVVIAGETFVFKNDPVLAELVGSGRKPRGIPRWRQRNNIN